MRNPFKKNTGALQLQHPIAILLVVIGAFLIGKLMSTSGIPLIAGLIFLPLIVIFINLVFYNPKIALFSIQLAAYFINGLPRYTGPIVPYGLIADGLFVLAVGEDHGRCNGHSQRPFRAVLSRSAIGSVAVCKEPFR